MIRNVCVLRKPTCLLSTKEVLWNDNSEPSSKKKSRQG